MRQKNKERCYRAIKFSTKNYDDCLLIFFGALAAIYMERSLASGPNIQTLLFWTFLLVATWVGVSVVRLFVSHVQRTVEKWVYGDSARISVA